MRCVHLEGTNSPHNINRVHENGTLHSEIVCDSCQKIIAGQRHMSLAWHEFDLCDHCIHTAVATSAEPFKKSGVPPVHHVRYDCAVMLL